MPTDREVRAVRKILYDRDRTRKMRAEVRSIVLLMNFDPGEAIPPNDPRVEPGAGPLWFIPATGAVNPSVLEAADRCNRLAELLMKTRRELEDVDFNRRDRDRLRDGLKHLATAWRRRGEVWRDPGRPDPDATADRIMDEERAAFRKFKRVKEYLE